MHQTAVSLYVVFLRCNSYYHKWLWKFASHPEKGRKTTKCVHFKVLKVGKSFLKNTETANLKSDPLTFRHFFVDSARDVSWYIEKKSL